jgi:hypothetical protein
MYPDPTYSSRIFALMSCTILVATLLPGCSLSGGTKSPYPRPEILSQTSSLRQDFIQEFLQGRWSTARSLFIQTQENLLRQDDFCSVAQLYVLAYKLHAYLGVEYPHLLDKAFIFSQQGMECCKIIGARNTILPNPRDMTIQTLLQQGGWQKIHTYLEHLDDPLSISVYARKSAVKAGQSSDEEGRNWARVFINQAHSVDKNQGWVLFLIEDWKLQQGIENDPAKKRHIEERIDTLYELVTPITQPIIEP